MKTNETETYSGKFSDAKCSRDDLDDGSESNKVNCLTRRTCVAMDWQPEGRLSVEERRDASGFKVEKRRTAAYLGSRCIPR